MEPPPVDWTWHDLAEHEPEGKGWRDTLRTFDRLPGRARGEVPESVWSLSRQSAGLSYRFVTDATAIAARWTLLSDQLALANMPATAVSGLDLYAEDGEGRWRWAAVGHPETFPRVEVVLSGGLAPGRRRYLLYLPLYNGVDTVEIGVPPGATFEVLPSRDVAPIVVYGTSIVQGASASRAGMCATAILGRRLDRPVINLGFSGSGKMEPALARLLAELDPCVFVVDCLPNMDADLVRERAETFLRRLRAGRPTTPIVVVEDRTYANAWIEPALRRRNLDSRAALRQTYETLVAAGDARLHYLSGERLLGDDDEATVDGSHPTDLGFARMAEALRSVVEPIIWPSDPVTDTTG